MSTQPGPKPNRRDITHERIVDVAARVLRRNGYSGVGVADVMKQAGLTHGGFYAHFASRDALLAEAMARAGRDSSAIIEQRLQGRRERNHSAFRSLVDGYLSEAHLRGTETGCVVAALGSEMSRQSPELLVAAGERVRGLIDKVLGALPDGASREQAMVIASTLVGSLQMARVFGANAQGKAMLAAARKALLDQFDTA